MRWNKKGLIYTLDGRTPWARSHAQIPTVDIFDSQKLRVLFSCRDLDNRSLIAGMYVRADNPSVISSIDKDPVLALGEVGSFDDCGVMPSSIVAYKGRKYLYYIGCNVRNTVPYHNSVGLAVSDDGGRTYSRLFDGPVMDRTADEPYFCASTCVRIENGIWRNWYLSCIGWKTVGCQVEPRYHLKYAESKNGINWNRTGKIAIDFLSYDEGAIARPSVVKDGDLYRMWYCYRGLKDYRGASNTSYRIGYAESYDGLSWVRMDDDAGIDIGDGNSWDSEMLAYPCVVDVNEDRYMFYNGNGFGRSGFGYAVLSK